MGWASFAIQKLQQGEQVRIRPRGHSMKPLVHSGDEVLVDPDTSALAKGDIVLCKVRGREFLHLVKAVSSDGRYQIGNNRGHVNGWVGENAVFGKALEVNGNPL